LASGSVAVKRHYAGKQPIRIVEWFVRVTAAAR